MKIEIIVYLQNIGLMKLFDKYSYLALAWNTSLNPVFMEELFLTKDEPYNLCSSNNLLLPRAKSSLYGIDAIRFIGQNCGRLCQEKLKSPNHWRFLKEILIRLKRLIATVNCVKVLIQM